VVVDTTKEWLADELAATDSTILIVDPAKARRLQADFRLDPLAKASQANPAVTFDFLTLRVAPLQPGATSGARPPRPAADKYRPLPPSGPANSSEVARKRIPE
jgi:hypothetical protein